MDSSIPSFSQKITALGFKSYEEYLNSEWWQSFRLRYFRSKRRKHCMCCEEPNFMVELHHKTYERLGRELLGDVLPLCREHHEEVHEILKQQYNGDIRWSERVVAFLSPNRFRRGKGLRRGRKHHYKPKKSGQEDDYEHF